MRKILIIAAALLALASCREKGPGQNKPIAQGDLYNVMVVMTNTQWEAEIGDTVRSILLQEVDFLNSREPLFDISRVVPGNFGGLIARNRNILMIKPGEDYREPAITAAYDIYAAPQLIITAVGPDERTVTDYISEHRQTILNYFELAERQRDVEYVKDYGDKTLKNRVKEQFGFDVGLQKGYILANHIPDKDFMWLTFDYPRAFQGIVIYSYPYSGRSDLTVEALVARRNEFTALVPGENEGSHMTTYDGFIPDLKHIRINGRYWAEMRGFWDVERDFMGGPFVSYSTIDTEKNRVVTLDMYVHSPDRPKRNFMRQLEHTVHTVSFPGDAEITGQ